MPLHRQQGLPTGKSYHILLSATASVARWRSTLGALTERFPGRNGQSCNMSPSIIGMQERILWRSHLVLPSTVVWKSISPRGQHCANVHSNGLQWIVPRGRHGRHGMVIRKAYERQDGPRNFLLGSPMRLVTTRRSTILHVLTVQTDIIYVYPLEAWRPGASARTYLRYYHQTVQYFPS